MKRIKIAKIINKMAEIRYNDEFRDALIQLAEGNSRETKRFLGRGLRDF